MPRIHFSIAAFAAMTLAAPMARAATFDDCSGFAFSEVAEISGHGDGSVKVITPGSAACSFKLKGSDSQGENLFAGDNVVSSFGATADEALKITATFDFVSQDSLIGFDFFGFFIGEVFTPIAGLSSLTESGTVTFSVGAGQSFGFFIETIDDVFGRATARVDVDFTPVPVPAGLPLLGTGLGLIAAFGRRQKA